MNERPTDEDISEIASRWKQIGYLRDLYLDEHLYAEFENFRVEFASSLSKPARAAMVQPEIMLSSKRSSCTTLSQSKQARLYDLDFKARFHRSLCLHSMALAALHLGRNVRRTDDDSSEEDDDLPELDSDLEDEFDQRFVNNFFCLWSQKSVVMGGKKIFLSESAKLNGLETFDFFYMFLLKKLLFHDHLDAWTENDKAEWPYSVEGYNYDPADRIDEWYHFLQDSRRVLHPQKKIDIIRHSYLICPAESNYPVDKNMYVQVRGMFDLADGGEIDWAHKRCTKVQDLLYREYINVFDMGKIETEEPC